MTIEEQIKTNNLPLSRKLIINLLLSANYASDNLSEALKPFDISLQQFNVLRILRGQKGKPANLSTINERMISKMSNTTRLVDKLITKGFVNRSICPSNRRKVEITITTQGLAFLKKVDPVINTTEEKMTANINTEQLEALNTAIELFRNHKK